MSTISFKSLIYQEYCITGNKLAKVKLLYKQVSRRMVILNGQDGNLSQLY